MSDKVEHSSRVGGSSRPMATGGSEKDLVFFGRKSDSVVST